MRTKAIDIFGIEQDNFCLLMTYPHKVKVRAGDLVAASGTSVYALRSYENDTNDRELTLAVFRAVKKLGVKRLRCKFIRFIKQQDDLVLVSISDKLYDTRLQVIIEPNINNIHYVVKISRMLKVSKLQLIKRMLKLSALKAT
jgi:hypothetical protein